MHEHNGQEPEAAVLLHKRRKGIYILPNLFTLAALFGGFYAVVMAMNGRFDLSAVGIFCAMVLDSLDGRVARMTNTQSAFGEQMDSLSDMVSFGAAPALIAYIWALNGLGRWGWVAAFVYCACAALRLARFNVNTAVVDKRYFQGLPSPAAAALVAAGIIGTDAAALFRPDHGDQRAVLQFQGCAAEEKRAFCGHCADRARHCDHQYPPSHRAVCCLHAVWLERLCHLRLAQDQGAADQHDQHFHG